MRISADRPVGRVLRWRYGACPVGVATDGAPGQRPPGRTREGRAPV